MNGYFSPDFAEVETCTLRLWLHQAQVQLPGLTGAARELLKQGIRDCASELKYRYRRDLQMIDQKYVSA